jgi:hypothetical protein
VGTKTYATYARNRAALVYAAQAAKSVSALRFLLVNVGEGIAYVDDASKGTLDKSTSWRPVDQLTFAGSAETIPLRFRRIDATKDYPLAQFRYPIEVQNGLVTPPGWEDRPVFSIVHWYEILETFGRAAPGSIVEASILSHGYSWGPILLDSYRDPSFQDPNDPLNLAMAARPRDPADIDGRADADFVEPTMPSADAQTIHDAFAPDGIVWLWGCSAFGALKRLVLNLQTQPGYKADGSTPDATMFQFTWDSSGQGMQELKSHFANDPFLPATGVSAQRSLGDFKRFLEVFIGSTYAARLADTLDVPCFAAAPGTGAAADKGRLPVHEVSAIYEPVVKFYEKYLNFKRDAEGRRYVNYKR